MFTASSAPASCEFPAWRWSPPTIAFAAAAVALLGLWIGFYLIAPLGFDTPNRDSWHHAAVLRELMAHPFDPSNPHIPTNEPSRYYTPISIITALVGKALGLTPYRAFGLLGAVGCIGFIAGCWTFARRYYGSEWAPLCLLLTLMFAWGAQMGHAGFHTYATFLTSGAYPATLTLVLGLFAWAMVIRALDAGVSRVVDTLSLGALAAVTLLTHQLGGVIALAGAGSLALFHGRASPVCRAWLVAALIAGALITLAWPYFDIVTVLASTSDGRWRSTTEGINHLSTLIILAFPAIAGLFGLRAESGWRWELIAPIAVFLSGFAALWVAGSEIAHRLIPGFVLYAQLGLVWVIVNQVAKPAKPPLLKATLAVIAALAGLTGYNASVMRLHDLKLRAKEGSLQHAAQNVAAEIPVGAIAFATDSIVFPLQSTGRRVVSIPRPEPVAPSLIARQAGTEQFFAAGTDSATRRALARRWQATRVVFDERDLEPAVADAIRALGSVRSFDRHIFMVTISPAAGATR